MVVIMDKEYLSKQEFAQAVDMCYNTISNWVEKGWIKPAHITERGRHLFTQEQVEAYWRGEYMPVKKAN